MVPDRTDLPAYVKRQYVDSCACVQQS